MAGKLSLGRMKALLAGNAMTSISTADDATVGSGLVLSDVGTVAADGGSISDAAAVATHVAIVTAANGTKGVKLPTGATTGEVYVVGNHAAAVLKLYAQNSETLNGVVGATGLSVSGSAAALCIKSGASTWTVVLP